MEGETATDPCLGLTINPLQVSKASYQGGQDADLGSDNNVTIADLKKGYTSYGVKHVGQ